MQRGWSPRRGNQLTALKLPKLLQENSEPLKLIKETLEVEKNPAPAIRNYAFESIIETPRSSNCCRRTQLAALKLPKLLKENSELLKLIKETLEVERNPAPAISKYTFETIIKNILGVRQEHLRGQHQEDQQGHL